MNIKSVVEAIRATSVSRIGGSVIQSNDPLIDEIERLLGGVRPTAEGVNSLIRRILTTNREIKPNDILKDLRLSRTPPGMEWKVQVLELLQRWLSGENIVSASRTGDTQTLQPGSPADLRLATEATLIAATGSATEDSLHNIPHARKMLTTAGLTPGANDLECWQAWEAERPNWGIVRNSFSAKLVSDDFNSSPHVKNLFVFKRKVTGQEVLMGPDDARGLFDDRVEDINRLETGKTTERKTYQKKTENTLRLIRLFDAAEQVSVRDELTTFRDFEQIGDAEYSVIDKHYTRLQQLWSEKCSAVYSLDDFLTAVDNVQKVCQDVSGRGHTLNRFKDQLDNADRIITAFYEGNIPSASDVETLGSTYRELLQFQKQLPVTDAYLASGRRVEEPVALMYARPRAHAALIMLDIIAGRRGEGELQIIDLCGNGVLYQTAKQLNDGHHNGLADCIVDLERVDERSLFEKNPNPRKVLVDFPGSDPNTPPVRIVEQSDSTSLQAAGKRIVVLNFVLNHLDPDEIKQTVLAARALNPDRLLISLPENCQLEQSNLYNILQVLGFRQELVLHGANELEGQTDFEIRTQRKSEISSGVRNRVKKPYRVYVLGRENIDVPPAVTFMNGKYFALVKSDSEGTRSHGEAEDPGALNPKLLQKLDATSGLSGRNFIRPDTSTVSAHDIVNNPQYKEFEERLAAMLHFRNFLQPKERKTLDEIANLWISKFVPSLTTDQVGFVMDRPNHIRISTGELPPHLASAQPQSRKWISLWQLYELEKSYRGTKTGLNTVVQEKIPPLDKRLVTLLRSGMEKVESDIRAIKIISLDGRTIDLNAAKNTIGGILKTVCIGGTVLMHKVGVPKYFAVGSVYGDILNASNKRTGYVFQASPTWAVYPSDLTARFRDDMSFSERVRLHQVNANYTDEGLEFFLSRGIPVNGVIEARRILKAVRTGNRELTAQEKQWLAKALQVDIKDLDPAGESKTFELAVVSSSVINSPLYIELRDEPGSDLIDKITKLRLRKLSELTEKLRPITHPTPEDIQKIVRSVGFVSADINLCTNDEYALKEQELHFNHCRVSTRNGETLFITPMVLYPKDIVRFFPPDFTTAKRVFSLLVNANITPKCVAERGIKSNPDTQTGKELVERTINQIIRGTWIPDLRWKSILAQLFAVDVKDLEPVTVEIVQTPLNFSLGSNSFN